MSFDSRIRAAAFVLAVALPLAALADSADPAGDLKKSLAAKDKAGVVAAMKACAAKGDEKAAALILQIALSENLDKLFQRPEDSNDIYDGAEEALGAFQDPKAEAYIHGQLHDHKDVRYRVFLVDVVARRKGDAAEAALVGALEDRSPLVQKPVLRHLLLKKSVKGIEPAIALLAKTEKKRDEPWLDAHHYLTLLTGMDLATSDEWRGWWAQAKATFDPRKVAPPKMGGETVARGEPITITEVDSNRCVFILDVSGSMEIKDLVVEKGQKGRAFTPKDPQYASIPAERMRIARLKDAMVKLIKELPATTRFTIITFATSTQDWQKKLVEASPGNKEDAIAFSEAMQPSGFTVTDEALRAAFDVPDADTFYFLSDGIPQRGKTASGAPDYIPTREILEEVQKLNRTRKVKIFTIGMGEADRQFMKDLAAANDGTFTAVE